MGLEVKTFESIVLDEVEIKYELIKSKRRKSSLVMKMSKQGILQLRVPYLTSRADIDSFLILRKKWIFKQQQRIQTIESDIGFSHGSYQYFKGQKLKLEIIKSNSFKVSQKDSSLLVLSANHNIQTKLQNWFKSESLEYLQARTFQLAEEFTFRNLKAIKVRKMTASWGNCRSNGVITFNYNLIKAPVELIDYVIIHELCHLIHQNHSAQFYQLQASIMPQWRTLKKQLDDLATSIL